MSMMQTTGAALLILVLLKIPLIIGAKKNRNSADIMAAARQGRVVAQDTGFQPSDYSKFVNPVTGEAKIFTRDDIGRMSQQEYADNKNAIEAQMSKIGLPKSSEVKINYSGRSSGSSGSSGRSGGSSGSGGSEGGRWVTINGNHVFIED